MLKTIQVFQGLVRFSDGPLTFKVITVSSIGFFYVTFIHFLPKNIYPLLLHVLK